MRADARRNYERLLVAGQEAFAEHGDAATLDDIARRAGVGPGTLYRHFPNREALLEAIYRDATDDLCKRGSALAELDDAGLVLRSWLELLVGYLTAKRGLPRQMLESLAAHSDLDASTHNAIHDVTSHLLDKAKAAGVVRADAAATDLLWLTNGVALAAKGPGGDERAERMLGIVIDGLRRASAE